MEEDPTYYFEYITATAAVQANDRILCEVLNYSTRKEWARVRIYRNAQDGAIQVMDSGDEEVVSTWQWGLAYEVRGGNYWVQVMVSSEFLIPRVSFESLQAGAWRPLAAYLPGDFAVFELLPVRRRKF